MNARTGIVLGGGGVTGAAYEIAALMAIRLATGWEPNRAEVVIGTSAGSGVAGLVRGHRLDVGTMVREMEDEDAVARRISSTLYPRSSPGGLTRWMRRGLLPGLRSPGVSFVLGAPGRLEEVLNQYADVGPSDVREAAERHLPLNARATIIVVPEAEAADAK